jgi:F0F1-type ATP synthase membrane subunit c/vacuolar-type H+-ATPase subunit K
MDGLHDPLLALAIALLVGPAVVGGALGQSRALAAGLENIGRNPGASEKIFTPMLLGMSLIESLVILAGIHAIVLTRRFTTRPAEAASPPDRRRETEPPRRQGAKRFKGSESRDEFHDGAQAR